VKKMMVMAVCAFSAFAYGAENTKDLMLSVGGTLFHIVKDDIYKHHALVDCMVVGRNQQRELKKPDFGDCSEVGKIYSLENKVRVLAKESDSASDDDTYKPWTTKTTELWKKAEDKTLECNVFAIIEPRIMSDHYTSYGYFPKRPHPEKKNYFFEKEFIEDEAILEASKDLKMCYNKSLQHGLEVLGDKDNKKIALASLNDAGFPRHTADLIAFEAIIDFLTHNPGKYSLVKLFVRKRSEFVLFRELVRQYLSQQQ
jgi:hypothetical protein